ncbi:hypothetical protein JTE90_017465 [Oedothorax gibbosus]|uniref:Uncharacterized protein n=1 Tax=Oedothorax gibbosus TaxID=931172 RepID=A0AAV6U2C9_9ARAC|nr:hypothetical protein JTE90_017465 [Oedothorax gibbosus]
MAISKSYWSYILSTCLLIQCLAVPVLSAPPQGKRMIRAQPRQSPLSPSQFALAATRFIVMLPFLPLMMAIPGVTGVMMPLFMALQDRLRTMIPNMGRPSSNNNNNNNASPPGGVVTNLLTAFNGGGGSNVNPISQSGTVSNLLSALGIGGGNSNSQNQNQQGSAEAVAGSEDSASEVPSFFRFKRSLPNEDMNKGIGEVLDFLSKSADAFSGRSESKPNDQESSFYGGNEDEIREVFDFLYSSAIGGLVKNDQEQPGSGTVKDTSDPLNITSALVQDFKEVVDFFQLINHAFSHNGEADAFEGASKSSHKDNQNRSQIKRVKRGILKLPTKALNEGFKEVFEILHKTDDALNMLTSGQPDCRRQAVCRLHHKFDPSIGSFLGNLIEVLQLESKVEKLDISVTTRSIIKDILKAANTGLFRKDCSSVYSRCSISAF